MGIFSFIGIPKDDGSFKRNEGHPNSLDEFGANEALHCSTVNEGFGFCGFLSSSVHSDR